MGDRASTYGIKTVEKVLDLMARFDAARAVFDTDVFPRLGAAVAAATVDNAERNATEKRDAEAAAEEEKRRADEKAQQLVAELLAASKQLLIQLHRKAAETEERCHMEA